MFDRGLLWRVAAVQVAAVAVLSIALALALPHSFFRHWGWISGPVAWMACAALTAHVLKLKPWPTLARAALAGLPAIPAVLLGVHWLGALIAVGLFALWCSTGELPTPRRRSGDGEGDGPGAAVPRGVVGDDA